MTMRSLASKTFPAWLGIQQRMATLILASHTDGLGEFTNYHLCTRYVAEPLLKVTRLSPPDRGQVGEGAQNQKGGARKVPKDSAGDLRRGGATAKKIA